MVFANITHIRLAVPHILLANRSAPDGLYSPRFPDTQPQRVVSAFLWALDADVTTVPAVVAAPASYRSPFLLTFDPAYTPRVRTGC